MDANGDYQGTLSTWEIRVRTNPTESTLPVSGLPGYITDLNVKLNLTYPQLHRLKGELVAPDGTTVTLFNGTLTGANLVNMAFDNLGGALTTAPYTGTFNLPSLTSFNGKNPNGVWKLSLTDTTGSSLSGVLVDWQLEISYAPTRVQTDLVGDVNGDGLEDLAFSEPRFVYRDPALEGAPSIGRVYLLPGRTAAAPVTVRLSAIARRSSRACR